jgi:hypothetical protein
VTGTGIKIRRKETCATTQKKDGSAGYLKASRTEGRAQKKIKKGRLRKKEETGEFW